MTSSSDFWQRMQSLLGEEYDDFYASQNTPLPKTLRVNTLKNSKEEFLKWAKKSHPDWILNPHPFGEDIFLIDREDRSTPLGKSLGHIQGRFYIQEASSCLPPKALNSQPGEHVLDLCAAPGSKSTQIAAQMQGEGLLLVNEFSASRAKILVFNLQKIGVPHGILAHCNGEKIGALLPNFFDKILVDAPCTGEGTFRKDSKALDHWSLKKIKSAAILQQSLLESAFLALKEGGTIIYSTCTLGPEENEMVVEKFLEKHPEDAQILPLSDLFLGAEKCPGLSQLKEGKEDIAFPHGDKMLRILPHIFNSEGFFVAALQKTKFIFVPRKKSFTLHGNRDKNALRRIKWKDDLGISLNTYLEISFHISLPKQGTLLMRGTDIWLSPDGSQNILQNMRVDRPGIKIAKYIPNGFVLSHECAIAFGKDIDAPRSLSLSSEEAREFLTGKNISPHCLPLIRGIEGVSPEKSTKSKEHPLLKGEVMLFANNLPLGMGKVLPDGTVKNKLPRNFVR